MKVICINDKQNNGAQHPYLKFDEIYEPSGEGLNNLGEKGYIISHLPPTMCRNGKMNNLPVYRKTRFIPLSDIDETEMEREYNKQLV